MGYSDPYLLNVLEATMFRKSVFLLLASLIIISGQFAFATSDHPVSAEQIIIAEPTTEKITNDKSVYVTVNITNVKVTSNPIIISLARIDRSLPFADELGSDLKVSVMKLSSNAAGELDKTVIYNMNYDVDAPLYSEDYKKETQVINRFFEVKDLILSHNYEISTINKKYRFDLIVGNTEEISKLSTEVHEFYKRWVYLKANVSELKKEYTQLQTQYIKYFERQILVDEINTLSYFKVVGKLPNGNYKLRFIDDEEQLIKEFTFEVIDREETIKLIDPLTN